MKIVIMTSGTVESSITHRPLAFAKELVKKGYDVYLFSLTFDKYSNFKDVKTNEIDNVKIIRPIQLKLLSFELSLISYIISSAFLLLKIKPTVIHISKPNPVTIAAIIPNLLIKTKLILDLDDADTEVMKIEKQNKFKIALVALSEKILSLKSTAIVTASKYLYETYRNLYKKKAIVYIPNGNHFTHVKTKIINKKLNNNIVFIGNMNRVNILEPLFYAIKELRDRKITCTATIIGDGMYLEYFKKLSKKLEIDKQISFTGHLNHKEIEKEVTIGDIGYCYMPNELTIKACSNMKVFHYMKYGIVPIVSDVGDLPSYVYNGKAGYIVRSNSTHLLSEALLQAFSDPVTRMRKIEYAQLNAKHDYDWSVLTEKLNELYKKL